MKVHLIEGDILSTNSKNILIPIGEDRQLKDKGIAKKIKECFGPQLQQALDKLPLLKFGEVVCIPWDGYNLFFARSIHYEIFRLTILGVEKCLIKVFELCQKMTISSLTIPAIATGNLTLPDEDVATVMKMAITEWTSQYPKNITIVLHTTETYNKFRKIFG